MRVLVTGGSGFIGSRLELHKPNWVYVSSSDYSLTSEYETRQMFYDVKPDAVLHLAAKVGGIKDNFENQVAFLEQNTLINLNVVRYAFESGVKRLLGSLSTCAFPDTVSSYPFNEEDIFAGPPAETNFSYGYAKRMLHVLISSYRKQYGADYSTFSPSNIYGPGDRFDAEDSHFIPALISKVARLGNKGILELWGTGNSLRQQLYVDDLCNIIPLLLDKHHGPEPLIVSPHENLSIDEMAKILISQLKTDVKIIYNNKLDGQYRKDGKNDKLLKLIGPYDFTSYSDGIMKTYNWYINREKI